MVTRHDDFAQGLDGIAVEIGAKGIVAYSPLQLDDIVVSIYDSNKRVS